VILVPLDCLTPEFPNTDCPLAQIVWEFDADSDIRLSLMIKRDSIGSATDFFSLRLTLDLVTNSTRCHFPALARKHHAPWLGPF
jgi:hypothetical protein